MEGKATASTIDHRPSTSRVFGGIIAHNTYISGNVGPIRKPSASNGVNIGTTSPIAKLEVSGQYFSTKYGLTDGATIALDWNNANVQSVTLGGNRTFTFANGKSGGRYVIMLTQDATGSRTITWPASVKWPGGTAPTLTTTASKTDIITFVSDGTNYYGGSSYQSSQNPCPQRTRYDCAGNRP